MTAGGDDAGGDFPNFAFYRMTFNKNAAMK